MMPKTLAEAAEEVELARINKDLGDLTRLVYTFASRYESKMYDTLGPDASRLWGQIKQALEDVQLGKSDGIPF